MKNLSSREKFLLKVLACLLFVTFFVLFVFKPQLAKLEENKLELQDTEFKVDEMNIVLSRYGKQDSVIKEKSEELDIKDEYIIPAMDNEEIEKFIMNLAGNDSGININRININDPVVAVFDIYAQEVSSEELEENDDYNLKEYYYQVNGISDEEKVPLTLENVTLLKNEVNISFEASFDQYKSFIDSIYNSNLSIYINSSDSELETNGNTRFNVSLNIYSAEGKE